jgi:hypothetical protein
VAFIKVLTMYPRRTLSILLLYLPSRVLGIVCHFHTRVHNISTINALLHPFLILGYRAESYGTSKVLIRGRMQEEAFSRDPPGGSSPVESSMQAQLKPRAIDFRLQAFTNIRE